MFTSPFPISSYFPGGCGSNARLSGTWRCPDCHRLVFNWGRPGRPRIYCANACRQRAYRWRRDHGARLRATLDDPPERAFTSFRRSHALRSGRDVSSRLSDVIHRELTICGVLARPSRSTKSRHDDFVLSGTGSCRRCIELATPPGSSPPALNRSAVYRATRVRVAASNITTTSLGNPPTTPQESLR